MTTGEFDTFTTPAMCRELAATCADSQFTTIRNADHMVHLQRSTEIVDLMLRFFADRQIADLPYSHHIERITRPHRNVSTWIVGRVTPGYPRYREPTAPGAADQPRRAGPGAGVPGLGVRLPAAAGSHTIHCGRKPGTVLLINSTGDPATPYAGAGDAAHDAKLKAGDRAGQPPRRAR